MQPLQLDYYFYISDNFSKWIRPLSYLPPLPTIDRESFLAGLEGDERDSAERVYEFRQVTRWKAVKDTITQITEGFIRNQQYLIDIERFKKEIILNGLNLSNEDDRKQDYKKKIHRLLKRLREGEINNDNNGDQPIESLNQLEIRWNSEGNELSRNHFWKEALSFPLTSPHCDEIMECFFHICFYIDSIIEHMKLQLDSLGGALKEYFGENTSAHSDQNLTKRHYILIHFYEGGKMVERKHKDYNDYNKFCTPRKRLAYPNNSQSKLRRLIKDIEIIKPLLSENASQDADSELDTFMGRLTVEN